MVTDGSRWGAVAVGAGGIGLILTLALEAGVAFASGIWYPVFYDGAPAVAAPAAFVHERPGVGRLRLLGIGAWFLVGSVLALAAAVVLALGFPAETPRSPVSTLVGAGLLYLGFLFVPVALAVAAARRRGLRTLLLLALSPVGQAAVAAALVIAR